MKKGLFSWLAVQQADVVCLQEVRAGAAVVSSAEFQLPAYHCYYQSAQKPGYSGVAIFTRLKPRAVVRQLGFPLADEEGRYLHVEFDNCTVASLYLPSGTSGEVRQKLKYEFMDRYLLLLDQIKKTKRPWIICGDWNIAHQRRDLKNWRANQTHSGFLPEERAWLDRLFDEKEWVDAFRVVNQETDQYTWWSHRGRAFENNTGWRIDYQIISPDLKETVVNAEIYKAQRFSDHAPLIIEYQKILQ